MIVAIAALLAVQPLTFRTSEIDVTPPEPLPLGGYTARNGANFEPGGDKLFARTLLLEAGGGRVAIVSLESLTIPASLAREVAKRLPADMRLMLVATHTHSAPDSQMLNDRMTFKVPGIASFSRRWLGWYADRIAEGVASAAMADPKNGAELRLAWADVAANRARRDGATPGKAATWALFRRKPVLTVYAAHGTVLDETRMTLSGDWPGAYSAAVGGLVLPGPIGDVSPDVEGDDSVGNLASMVERLKSGLAEARVMDMWGSDSVLVFVQEAIELDPAVPHPEFAEAYGAASPLDQVLVSRFAPKRAQVTVVLLGRLLLIGIPGEPTSDVGRKVQVMARSMGFPHSVVISHCNGWIGYILEPDDYDRGGYEATLSFNGRGTAVKVQEAVARALKNLRAGHMR
ncbi:MAG: hypothetical protein IH945_04690 [Armatimonadetes bacterium]|nr:hypothetical protein [Armatimonadota bacterium]